MGNCCNLNTGFHFSSVNLLNNQVSCQPTTELTNISVKTMTWNKDSYDLFDYENANRIVQQMIVDKSTHFYFDTISGNMEQGNEQVNRILLGVETKDNYFWVQPKVRIYLNQQEKKDYPVWLVIRSIQQKESIKVSVNDVLRIGKVEVKLTELHFGNDLKLSDENNRDTILSQSNDEDRCRICLLSSQTDDDPKITPCKCSGSMGLIHLKCLQRWIVTKTNLVEENLNIIAFFWDQMKCELCKTNFQRNLIHNGSNIDLVDFSKQQFANYAILELKKTMIKEAERFTYILNLSKVDAFKVGRANDNHIRLCDISVSRFHCKLYLSNKQFYIQDNNSKFGTLLKLKKAVPIFKELNGVQFQSGRTVFEFETEKLNSGYKLF